MASAITGQIESTFLRDLLSWVMPVLVFFGLWWYLGKRVRGQVAASAAG